MAATSMASRFFVGVTEYVFQIKLGLADPRITDYLSAMLLRFMRTDSLYQVRYLASRPMDEVVDMIEEADRQRGLVKRKIQQHIGDFTLFWVGVYPEALSVLRGRHKKDSFIDYCAQGKKAYHDAACLTSDESKNKEVASEVLLSLSDKFEVYALGLHEVREEWQRDGRRNPLSPFLWR